MDSLLSLRQIKSLVIDLTDGNGVNSLRLPYSLYPALEVAPDRVSGGTRDIDSLRVNFCGIGSVSEQVHIAHTTLRLTSVRDGTVYRSQVARWGPVLAMLNPRRVTMRANLLLNRNPAWCVLPYEADLGVSSWTRVKEVTFIGQAVLLAKRRLAVYPRKRPGHGIILEVQEKPFGRGLPTEVRRLTVDEIRSEMQAWESEQDGDGDCETRLVVRSVPV